MKTYIMFCFVESVGGGQNYVNTKVRWLKEHGWNVVVFGTRSSLKYKDIPWFYLKEYRNYQKLQFNKAPEFWSDSTIEKTLKWMEDCIGETDQEVIIESHTDFFAEWGERLAQRIGAKHICFLLDEQLWKYHAKEFLYYKFLRNEIAGIHTSSMKKLFDGYKQVEESDRYVLKATHDGGVADISCDKIDRLTKSDWNIAYIGRNKQYVPNIIQGIKEFCKENHQKTIQFIILGEVNTELLKDKPTNLVVTNLGFITPIPKSFFKYVDVVIAGAGCATISARENVLTIVADAKTCHSAGVLGYTVNSTIFSENEPQGFYEALQDVLIHKICEKLPYQPRSEIDVEGDFLEHFAFINKSDSSKEYFDFTLHKQQKYTFVDRSKFYILMLLQTYCSKGLSLAVATKSKLKTLKSINR